MPGGGDQSHGRRRHEDTDWPQHVAAPGLLSRSADMCTCHCRLGRGPSARIAFFAGLVGCST